MGIEPMWNTFWNVKFLQAMGNLRGNIYNFDVSAKKERKGKSLGEEYHYKLSFVQQPIVGIIRKRQIKKDIH